MVEEVETFKHGPFSKKLTTWKARDFIFLFSPSASGSISRYMHTMHTDDIDYASIGICLATALSGRGDANRATNFCALPSDFLLRPTTPESI